MPHASANTRSAETRSVDSMNEFSLRSRSPVQGTPQADRAFPLVALGWSLLEKLIQRRFPTRDLVGIARCICASLRLEVITEIRLVFLANFLRRRLLAVLRIRRIVFNAHLADMQLRVARLARIQPPQRQTKRRQRPAATPAN